MAVWWNVAYTTLLKSVARKGLRIRLPSPLQMYFTTLSHMNNNITPTITELVSMHPDIKVIFYPKRSDDRSYCEPNKRIVHIGTMTGNETNIISTLLHEMGHIYNRRRNILDSEKAAWSFAKRYATKYGLPFNQKLMDSSLSLYCVYDKSLRESLLKLKLSKRTLNSISNSFLKKIARELVKTYNAEQNENF